MGETNVRVDRLPLRRTVKDSVFTNLFSDKRYTLQLYQSLHPEDTAVGVDDVEIVTIQNVMKHDLQKELGFVVVDRIIVLL